MKTTFFLLLSLCLLQLNLVAQIDSTLISPFKEVYVGQLDKVFITETQGVFGIMPNGNVKQYDFNGDLKGEHFFDTPLNDYQIDANNTFTILIFDKDFNKASFTDRWFRPISEIELGRKYQLACMAKTGELWLYNEVDHSIEKYNTTLQQTTVSISLKEYVSKEENIVLIKELGHLLAVRTDKKLYFSSSTGNSISSIHIDEQHLIHLTPEHLWKIDKGSLRKTNIYTKEIKEFKLELPEKSEIKNLMVTISGSIAVVATKEKFYYYKIPTSITY